MTQRRIRYVGISFFILLCCLYARARAWPSKPFIYLIEEKQTNAQQQHSTVLYSRAHTCYSSAGTNVAVIVLCTLAAYFPSTIQQQLLRSSYYCVVQRRSPREIPRPTVRLWCTRRMRAALLLIYDGHARVLEGRLYTHKHTKERKSAQCVYSLYTPPTDWLTGCWHARREYATFHFTTDGSSSTAECV